MASPVAAEMMPPATTNSAGLATLPVTPMTADAINGVFRFKEVPV